MTTKPRVALLQTAIGDYRQEVLQKLVESPDIDFTAYAGPAYFDGTTLTKVQIGDRLKPIQNHFLAGHRLLWQSGMWLDMIRAKAVIAEGNPRILSTWMLLAARKALGRRTVLWGHAWPRGGRHSRFTKLRRTMYSLAECVVVYTETQASELREAMPDANIIAAPNALYSASSMAPANEGRAVNNFIYVGRLVAEKKPGLLVDAFSRAVERLGTRSKLIIVGDGPLRPELEASARPLGDRVEFKGHIADWSSLREFYATSVASVSPGYVGLSITQSFSFGVPMIAARNEPHAPEIEAAREGENAIMFEENNAADLADKMVEVWKARTAWASKGNDIARDCAERYSAEVMASRLIESTGIEQTSRPPSEAAMPDRVIPGPLRTIRSLVRSARLSRHKILLRGKLNHGENVIIGPRAALLPPEFLRFGDNVSIAGDFHLETNLETGSDILISSRVSFIGNDHAFDDASKSVFWQGRNPAATVILEGDNLIGFGVIVIGDVRIGKGCIVGAGAVVTGDLPPNTICVGVPAKPIRERHSEDTISSARKAA